VSTKRKRKVVGKVDGRYTVAIVESEFTAGRWGYEIGRSGEMGCGVGYDNPQAASEAAKTAAANLENRLQAVRTAATQAFAAQRMAVGTTPPEGERKE
jgi:hypothetical protein